jgi:hypothetical protein
MHFFNQNSNLRGLVWLALAILWQPWNATEKQLVHCGTELISNAKPGCFHAYSSCDRCLLQGSSSLVLRITGGSSAASDNGHAPAHEKEKRKKSPSLSESATTTKSKCPPPGGVDSKQRHNKGRSQSEGALGRIGKPKIFRQRDSKLKIPEGWRQCRPVGEPINGTFIFSIRVPLDANFRSKVTNHAFEPQQVLDWRDADGKKIGLVIDLTFTDRYYNGTMEFQDRGVEYKKIPTKGHGLPPSPKDVRTFISTVSEFRKKNPDAYIAVHCTHGLNRSGFMIISYLVDVLRMHLTSALAAFARSNPPGMWDREYIKKLHLQYGVRMPSEDDMPALPSWKKKERVQSFRTSQQDAYAGGSQVTREVVIMRGLPGSGKTTFVGANFAESEVCSADAFFKRGANGYAFDFERIGEAHYACMAAFLRAIKVRLRVCVCTRVRNACVACVFFVGAWRVCVYGCVSSCDQGTSTCLCVHTCA